MKTKTEHTPTPWMELADGFIASVPARQNKNPDNVVAEAFKLVDKTYIVRAVNSHEALLDLVKRARKGIPGQAWCNAADQVIAQAEARPMSEGEKYFEDKQPYPDVP